MTDRKIFRLQILDLATEHFLVLSAAVLITAVVAGTMFLFGYLASFDWRLIFIIEYADILKISLIFVGALSTIIVLVAPVVSYLMHGEKRSPARLAIAAAMIIALLVALVFEESRSPDPRYAMLFIVVSNTFLAIALVAVISRAAVDPSQQTAPELIGIIVLALPAMLYFGWGFGIVARDSPGAMPAAYGRMAPECCRTRWDSRAPGDLRCGGRPRHDNLRDHCAHNRSFHCRSPRF